MRTLLRRALVASGSILVLGGSAGCGQRYFADRATNPVVGDYISHGTGLRRFGILSTAATRRSVVVQIPSDRTQPSLLCAEPPPDAVEAYANAVSAAVSASQASQASGSLELARNFATSAAPMLYRTQGLQMLRDSQYHLCNMYLNGVLRPDEYRVLFESVSARAAYLIEKEMNAVQAAAGRTPTAVTASNVAVGRAGASGGASATGTAGTTTNPPQQPTPATGK